jgi:hypothetical protein
MRRALVLVGLAALGCAGDDADRPKVETLELDVDIREHASVRLERQDDALDVRVTLSRGFGVAEDGVLLVGRGRVEKFPEAEVTLFTAKLDGAPVAGGPCGAEPVSLALALHRRGAAPRVSGSLTPYCGKGVWAGVPARNPLRLATPPAAE